MGVAGYAFVGALGAVGLQLLLLSQPKPPPPVRVEGSAAEGWAGVADAFRALHEQAVVYEGSAYAVYHKGELVVDVWGGYADSAFLQPWRRDTMAVLFSTTKAVSVLAVLMLVDRGRLDYDAPVAKYWPEFGAEGKEKVTVADLVEHKVEAGLAVVAEERQLSEELLRGAAGGDAASLEELAAIFESASPNWELGQGTHGYHGFTLGLLVDLLVRRVDGRKRSLATFIREEISGPLQADFHLGLNRSEHFRVARYLEPGPGDQLRKILQTSHGFKLVGKLVGKLIAGAVTGKPPLVAQIRGNPAWLNPPSMSTRFYDPEVLEIPMGSANGVGTARGLARVLSALGEGELVGREGPAWRRLLRPVNAAELAEDAVMGLPCHWNLGFWAPDRNNSIGAVEIGHPGFGGINVKLLPEHRLALAYVTNGLTPDMGDTAPAYQALFAATLEALKARTTA